MFNIFTIYYIYFYLLFIIKCIFKFLTLTLKKNIIYENNTRILRFDSTLNLFCGRLYKCELLYLRMIVCALNTSQLKN